MTIVYNIKILKEAINMLNIFKDFLVEEKGQTVVEWILILALIVIVIITVLTSIGKKAKTKGTDIDKALA